MGYNSNKAKQTDSVHGVRLVVSPRLNFTTRQTPHTLRLFAALCKNMNIQVNETLSMELLRGEHAQELFALTDINREYLREWLPWLDLTKTANDTMSFIAGVEEQYKSGHGPQYALKHGGEICGVAGYHKIDKQNRIGSIGYWLGEEYCGKGIMTACTQALLKIGFKDYSLHKIEISCAEKNTRSRAIPERLGFTYEATLRDCEWLYTRYVNHAIYSLLKSEENA